MPTKRRNPKAGEKKDKRQTLPLGKSPNECHPSISVAETMRFQPCTAPGFLDDGSPSLHCPVGFAVGICVYRSVAKKKVAAKKKKVAVKSEKKSEKMDPLMKEVSEVAEELEDILGGLRTSTVTFSRARIKEVVERLKSLGER